MTENSYGIQDWNDYLAKAVESLPLAEDFCRRFDQDRTEAGLSPSDLGKGPEFVETLSRAIAIIRTGTASEVIRSSFKRHRSVGVLSSLYLAKAGLYDKNPESPMVKIIGKYAERLNQILSEKEAES